MPNDNTSNESESGRYTNSITIQNEKDEIDLGWEEWDGTSPFLHHCIAGSIAGVAEHVLLYPVDTIKTHMQSYCAQCTVGGGNSSNNVIRTSALNNNSNTMWGTFLNLVHHKASNTTSSSSTKQQRLLYVATSNIESTTLQSSSSSASTTKDYFRLWRGVQAITIGCIPAHALYFSLYESTKHTLSLKEYSDTFSSAMAGASATMGHDVIMTPLDTIKQRLQLGHYQGRLLSALREVYTHEGLRGLFRSFPITLFTNIPYGMIMVSTNDTVRDLLSENKKYSIQTCLISGSIAGSIASALTTPLDRIKTRLQTQALSTLQPWYCTVKTASACPKQQQLVQHLKYRGIYDAAVSIVKEEGVFGLFRGISPRVLSHTPAVAISWTAYESAKDWLNKL